jgi:hypothetical protein
LFPFIQNQGLKYGQSLSNNVVQMCLKIIEYGTSLLSFSGFLKGQSIEVKDIVLSMIARLTKLSQQTELGELNLEQKLASLVGKKSYFEANPDLDTTLQQQSEEYLLSAESFDAKLAKLLETWKDMHAVGSNGEASNLSRDR